METTTNHAICATRRVAHDIELEMLRATREQVVNVSYAKVMELLSQLRSLRSTHPADAKYVPCVIIVNSVVKAIELEQKLLKAGIAKEHIVPIRGMIARAIRKLHADMLIVIGTSAIEVGIDFQCDYLIFEAGDAAAFMQRFGRLGRHAPGQAFLIASDHECRVLESSPILTRSELEGIRRTQLSRSRCQGMVCLIPNWGSLPPLHKRFVFSIKLIVIVMMGQMQIWLSTRSTIASIQS